MPSPTITLSRAKLYLERGWSVLPINPENKQPLGPWKHLTEGRPDINQLMQWLARWPDMHIGVIAGTVSKLLILDADRAPGIAEVDELGMPRTPTASSPHGRHYYLQLPQGRWGNRAKLGQSRSLDVRAEHGYVVAPPSRGYRWLVAPSTRLAEPPEWLLGLLSGPMTKETRKGGLGPGSPPPRVSLVIGSDAPLPQELSALLPTHIRNQIHNGHDLDRYPSRSEADAAVVRALVLAGASNGQIKHIFDTQPIGEKWREPTTGSDYLRRTVERCREYYGGDPAQLVLVQAADAATPPSGEGLRLYLGLKVLKGTLRGRFVRSGVSFPGEGERSERFEALLAAAGVLKLRRAKVAQICDALRGKKILVELDLEKRNPVVVFRGG